jgi:hypothetical protein
MARKTAVEEGRKLFDAFFNETKQDITTAINSTRVVTRRLAFMDELKVIDRVEGKAYDWFNARAAK